MIGLLCFVLTVLAAPIKSKMRLEAENAVLRHQLAVLRRRLQGRVRLTNNDRLFLILLYRCLPAGKSYRWYLVRSDRVRAGRFGAMPTVSPLSHCPELWAP
jgi:hypothetical protein